MQHLARTSTRSSPSSPSRSSTQGAALPLLGGDARFPPAPPATRSATIISASTTALLNKLYNAVIQVEYYSGTEALDKLKAWSTEIGEEITSTNAEALGIGGVSTGGGHEGEHVGYFEHLGELQNIEGVQQVSLSDISALLKDSNEKPWRPRR